MKKKSIFSIVVICLILCIFGTNSASAAIGSKLRVSLCGIIDPDGSDRTGWQSAAYTWMSKLDANVYRRTAFDKTRLALYIKNSDIFVIHTHGSKQTLRAVDENGIITRVTYSDIDSWALKSLSGLDLAYLGACEVGQGGVSAENMVNACFDKGAHCVIGYVKSVYTEANYIMIQEFCRAIGAGYTIQNALAYADARVLEQYGSSGNTNYRLVRGGTDVKFRNVTQLLSPLSIDSTEDKEPATVEEIVYFRNEEGIYGFFDPSKIESVALNQGEDTSMTNDTVQKNIADNYLKKHNENHDRYILSSQYYTEDTGITTYIYSNKIHDISTLDTAYIFMNKNNEIVSYSAPHMRVFENLTITIADLNHAELRLQDQLKELGIENYEITEKMIVLKNSCPALRYSVQHTIYDDAGEYNSIDDYVISLIN